MPLNKTYLNKLRRHPRLKKDVQQLLGISHPTMLDYLLTNHENFTRYTVLTAIASEYNTSVENIIEPIKTK